jgi:PIN domain nuclease of toxin-antitoxin system
VRLLLDTHVWLWLALAPDRVAEAVRSQIERAENEVYVSVASLWEVVIKTGTGKLTLPDPAETFWRRQTQESGVVALAVRSDHVLDVAALPQIHRDPFDRLLVAQARVEGFTLVTADPKVRAYPVTTLAAEAS